MALVIIACFFKKGPKTVHVEDVDKSAINKATSLRSKRYEKEWRLGGAYEIKDEGEEEEEENGQNAHNQDEGTFKDEVLSRKSMKEDGFVVFANEK